LRQIKAVFASLLLPPLIESRSIGAVAYKAAPEVRGAQSGKTRTLRLEGQHWWRVSMFRRTAISRPPFRSSTYIGLIGIAVSTAVSVATAQTTKLTPWTGGEKPPFILSDLDGAPHDLATLRGRIVIVHFFATWCEPCREELPALQRLSARLADRDGAILAVSVAEVPLRVKRFMGQIPVGFPVLLDEDRAVAHAWSLDSLPTTFVLDRTLKPRLAAEGEVAWDGVGLDGLLASVSQTPASLTTAKHIEGR
jgi:thiol-disulfide isomerase/thioredoxin